MAYSLSGERPTIAAWPIVLVSSMLRHLAKAAKKRRRRLAFTALLEMDEHRLWDLGISRDDLYRAIKRDDFDIVAVRDARRGLDVWPPA